MLAMLKKINHIAGKYSLHFRLYESATLFFGDIVGFTKLTAMSTAQHTIKVKIKETGIFNP